MNLPIIQLIIVSSHQLKMNNKLFLIVKMKTTYLMNIIKTPGVHNKKWKLTVRVI